MHLYAIAPMMTLLINEGLHSCYLQPEADTEKIVIFINQITLSFGITNNNYFTYTDLSF